jgi:hypothetical protein
MDRLRATVNSQRRIDSSLSGDLHQYEATDCATVFSGPHAGESAAGAGRKAVATAPE